MEQHARDAYHEAQKVPKKVAEDYDRLKQDYNSSKQRTQRQQQQISEAASQQQRQTLPGYPNVGAIIAGFGCSLANELAEQCVKDGICVANVGLGCKSSTNKPVDLSDGTKVEIVDCESVDAANCLERAKDSLEKEGVDAVIVLDVSQDWRTIETYNKLKIPFVHAGSERLQEELRMHEQVTSAKNACVISPFISREGALLQLMLETFARSHPGIFRDWKLDVKEQLSEENAVASAKRRTLNALSFLVDEDPSCFEKCSSGKGTLSGSDEKSQDQQQQQQQQQGQEQQQQEGEQHQSKGIFTKMKEAVTGASEAVSTTKGKSIGSSSSFTLRSPDGKHSFTIGHEHYGAADVNAIVDMALFLGSKIKKGREPRVWGIKDWAPGMEALNREIADCCECEFKGQRRQRQRYAQQQREDLQRQEQQFQGEQLRSFEGQQEKYQEHAKRAGEALGSAASAAMSEPYTRQGEEHHTRRGEEQQKSSKHTSRQGVDEQHQQSQYSEQQHHRRQEEQQY